MRLVGYIKVRSEKSQLRWSNLQPIFRIPVNYIWESLPFDPFIVAAEDQIIYFFFATGICYIFVSLEVIIKHIKPAIIKKSGIIHIYILLFDMASLPKHFTLGV